ncbi:MAG TPA: hypothetical protein VFY71_01140, partial [Planctomycetota bacterium]|nr:hypothetical protein [Planctomycetota bacterium]
GCHADSSISVAADRATADGTHAMTWDPGVPVYTTFRAPDRTVVVSVSSIVRNNHDLLCRVVAVADVFDAGKWRSGATQGVQEVTLDHSGKVGSGFDGSCTTLLHPREGLTWREVKEPSDLVLDTEPE